MEGGGGRESGGGEGGVSQSLERSFLSIGCTARAVGSVEKGTLDVCFHQVCKPRNNKISRCRLSFQAIVN